MASDWETGCDAIAALLQGGITALNSTNATLHRYEPWSVEELTADGRRHLAVWPSANGADARPLAEGAHEISQGYEVMVWEDASIEDARRRDDEDAAKTFLQIEYDIRALVYANANQNLDSSERSWYVATRFAGPGQVRAFTVFIEVLRYFAFD